MIQKSGDVFRARPLALPKAQHGAGIETALSIASPLLVLVLWEALVRLGYLEALFFPPPTKIIETLVKVLLSGELVSQTAITLRRMALAFILGTAPGLILGLLGGSRGDVAGAEPVPLGRGPVRVAVPVQRQRFPEIARRISASLGCGFRSSKAAAESNRPGVQ